MAPPSTHPTARRTQAVRAAETQQALLDAAIACLVEHGYAGTTTREVAQRAGVSRGAQTHHYPSKNALVVAAIEHLYAAQTERFVDRFGALPPARRTLDEAIALLWELVSEPTYAAVLEVVLAARTDPELSVVVQAVTARFDATLVRLLKELFPVVADDHLARTAIDIAFTFVTGAAMSTYAGHGDQERTIRLVRALAAFVTPQSVHVLSGVLDVLDP